jgi:hypothetical protein
MDQKIRGYTTRIDFDKAKLDLVDRVHAESA